MSNFGRPLYKRLLHNLFLQALDAIETVMGFIVCQAGIARNVAPGFDNSQEPPLVLAIRFDRLHFCLLSPDERTGRTTS